MNPLKGPPNSLGADADRNDHKHKQSDADCNHSNGHPYGDSKPNRDHLTQPDYDAIVKFNRFANSNADGRITVKELIRAVNAALGDCNDT